MKDKAIICDIDRTIAKITNRHPYDWSRVEQDVVIEDMADLIRCLSKDYKILFLTGRDGRCVLATKNWLSENHIPYEELYMRPPMNNDQSVQIKEDIYMNKISKIYDVKLVVDDDRSVVNMFRAKGLKVLQPEDN